MSSIISDASMAQSQLAQQQMDALAREAEATRRSINAGAPIDKEKKLRGACEGFEAVFVQKMWESMRASLPGDGLVSGSKEEKFWQGMYDQELGKSIAKSGGIGLADMMMEQLSRNLHSASDVTAGAVVRKPLNIEPAPLFPPDVVESAEVSDTDSMYDTPAPLQGEHVAKDASKGIAAPPVVQAALDDLAKIHEATMNQTVTVTTQTFVGGSSENNRRPISKQVRVVQAPNNAPAHAGINMNNSSPKADSQVASKGNVSTQTEPAPIAPYAADTVLIQEHAAPKTLASSIEALQTLRAPAYPSKNLPAGTPPLASGGMLTSIKEPDIIHDGLGATNGQLMPTSKLTMPPTPFSVDHSGVAPLMTPPLPLSPRASGTSLKNSSKMNKV